MNTKHRDRVFLWMDPAGSCRIYAIVHCTDAYELCVQHNKLVGV